MYSYDVTYAFQGEPALCSSWNVKEIPTRNRCGNQSSICLRNKWFQVGFPLESLGFIFDYLFGPKKDKIFCGVFLFHSGMSNGICDLILYLKSGG